MRVTYPQWTNYDGNKAGGGVLGGGVRQGKGKGKGNWNFNYQHPHQHYNNGYPSYHSHNQSNDKFKISVNVLTLNECNTKIVQFLWANRKSRTNDFILMMKLNQSQQLPTEMA